SGGQSLLSPMIRNRDFSPSFHLGLGADWQNQWAVVVQGGYTQNIGQQVGNNQLITESWHARFRTYKTIKNYTPDVWVWVHGGMYYTELSQRSNYSIASIQYDELEGTSFIYDRTLLAFTAGMALTVDIFPYLSVVIDTNTLAIPLINQSSIDIDQGFEYLRGLGVFLTPLGLQVDFALRFHLPLKKA
ncbi:MAG TPA: hypothetical protein DCE41_26495, partial [Cytophagales bacterium]|nr:hypothetical protein [Cytophagales bacterium]